jgi:hypothetical protein
MRETYASLIQSFVLGKRVTIDVGTAAISRHYLCRMMMFWHDVLVEEKLDGSNSKLISIESFESFNLISSCVGDEVLRHVPTLDSFESTLDLFSLVSLSMLANVLDERTYTGEQVPKCDRALYIATRRAAMMTVKWFFNTYELFDRGTQTAVDGYEKFWYPMLGMQATALLLFKDEADNQFRYDPKHSNYYTVEQLRQQLQYVIDIYPSSNKYFKPCSKMQESLFKPLTWLTTVEDLKFEVRKRPEDSRVQESGESKFVEHSLGSAHSSVSDDMYQSPALGYTLDDYERFPVAGSHSTYL